jgi:hypothetical protein
MPRSKPTGKKTKRMLVIAVVGLIVYFLSNGPALYLLRREILADRLFRVIYAPLTLLEDWHPYVTYLRWWYHTKAERE